MRLACWQAAVRAEDGERRLARLAEVAAHARDLGAGLLVTPEMSLTGYRTTVPEIRALADGAAELADRVARIAAANGIALVYGCPERVGSALFNTVHLVDAAGSPAATYRKTHLYGPAEQSAFTPGEVAVVQAEVEGTTVGLLVCYDVEFPELVRAHGLRGTRVLVVPSALACPWEFVAETLVPARAFENGLSVVYSNWAGPDGKVDYCGLSRVVDPYGRVRAGAPAAGEELLVADLDAAEADAARAATPYLADRRPSLYQDVAAPGRGPR
ncbi:carbon-nitrogen hydrolase family protein [Actinokineospora sp.]|uniref:carbon-nitrogen hydrolase family protein n=1 Tax=Actinokineospora sp. TaxID=1872133 RepID=UPI004037B3A6